MKRLIACALFATPLAFAQHAQHGSPSPYAGMEQREIKALSPEDTRKLLQGHGMSLALAAELNGYPGPSHVLELADEIRLDAGQRERTQALMAQHKAAAQALGRQLVEAERELDRLFADRQAAPATVDAATRRIGELQGELRAEHLRTHLAQKALLSAHQVAQYQWLRGYTNAHSGGHHR